MVEKLESIIVLLSRVMRVLEEMVAIGIGVLIGIGGDRGQGLQEGEGGLGLILGTGGEGLEVEVMIDDEDRCHGPFYEREL